MIYRYDPGCPCCDMPSGNDGYWLGGATGGFMYSAIYGINFASDTTSTIGSPGLVTDRNRHASCANHLQSCYTSGGVNGTGFVETTESFDFSTEASALLPSGNLQIAKHSFAAVSERTNKAYFAGGLTRQVFPYIDAIPVKSADKLTFASETMSAQPSAELSSARAGVTGLTQGTAKGYFTGGSSSALSNTTDKITFATDVTSEVASGTLEVARFEAAKACVSDGESKGFVAGGSDPFGFAASIEQLSFATDVAELSASATLSEGRSLLGGLSDGDTKGYFAGGTTGGGSALKTTDKLNYVTATAAHEASADLPIGTLGLTGCSKTGL